MPARLTVPTACDSSRPYSANSAPSTSRMRCGGSAGSHWRCARSWWNRRNAMCGCASAMRSIASTQCPNSVASERRNLRRAGTASNSWRTSTVVPGGPRRADLQAAAVDLPGVLAVARARDDGHLRDRGDGGQRLAAESHRRHRFQFGQRADLAGGVARQRQRQFLGRNAAAVVGHGDAADAAAFQPHFDARAPASIAFSSTSLSTDAGRSMTSPAAI